MADGYGSDGMLDMYLFENSQLLEKLQDIVLEQKDEECFDTDAINEIFRIMHTIKGSSGVMMFDEITAVSHKLEDVFYFIRESHPVKVPHIELVDKVLKVADFITEEMDKLGSGENADGSSGQLVSELEDFLNSIRGDEKEASGKEVKENVYVPPQQFYIAPAVSSSNSRYYKIYVTFAPGIPLANVHAYKIVHSLKEITDNILYFPDDIITNSNSGEELLENGFKILLQTQSDVDKLNEIIQPGYDIQRVDIHACTEREFSQGFESFGTEIIVDKDKREEDSTEKKAPAKIAPGDFVIETTGPGRVKKLAKDSPKKAEKSTFLSVDIKKMDMLMELIGELVISQSVVLQNPDLKVPGLKLDNFNKAAGHMSRISSELQTVIMSMRMVTLTNTFQKMNRIVFDVSRKLGKDIEFEMTGDTTEVDRNIIEHISDPLMHLVRNAVDHGIESPEERKKSGKTEKGKVTLSAKTESGKVCISVTDNGGGLDRAKIIAKARKQGLLDYTKPDDAYSDKEVYQFITLPGFSTNDKVTEYSGRGVGMDVVVSNIQSIGGSLEIESKPGQGSSMIMKIPLTLAIIEGIVMEAEGSSFVIEAGMVREFVNLRQCSIIEKPDREEFVMIRGEPYPVLRLGEWYHLKGDKHSERDGVLVVVQIDKRRLCLYVDKLIGKQEIVVKPIPGYIKKIRGLSGCTQLGDGSIALILDAACLAD